MEILIAIGVFVLAAAGLGLGLVFGAGPARTSCGAAACLPEAGTCTDCPLRRRAASEDSGR